MLVEKKTFLSHDYKDLVQTIVEMLDELVLERRTGISKILQNRFDCKVS